jgi:histidinol phosphatase-like PHP family hydrolase/predicted phosphodiesterase
LGIINKKMKIAIISDIHSPGREQDPEIRGDMAEMLLLRAINRFNRWIKPDIVIVCGDFVDGNDSQIAKDSLAQIRPILDKLACPYIAVRGNHDPSAEYFYKVFERKDQLDICGVRFLVFDDKEEPAFCASRSEQQIERFKNARANFAGPIVSVQHVPILPPGVSDCPYVYTNSEQIIAAMKKYNVFMSVSGHYHKGLERIQSDGMNFVTAPAVCESPFRYTLIETDGEQVSVTTDEMRLPPELGLVDRHVHTQLAYCSENMDAARILKLYKDLGLADIVFTEHSGQLYFNKESFWDGECYINGLTDIDEKNNRMEQYFELMKKNNVPKKSIGLEVDFDYAGRVMLKPQDRQRVGYLMGSIHKLSEMWKDTIDWQAVRQEYLFRTEEILKYGVDVLAHPFRLFHRKGGELPVDLYAKVIKLLKQYNTAAEVNYHSQEAEIDFARMCVESGVKLSLSSDSHNMYELGELWPHLKMLEKIGVARSDFAKILLS